MQSWGLPLSVCVCVCAGVLMLRKIITKKVKGAIEMYMPMKHFKRKTRKIFTGGVHYLEIALTSNGNWPGQNFNRSLEVCAGKSIFVTKRLAKT